MSPAHTVESGTSMNFEFTDLPLWDHLRMHLLEGAEKAMKQAVLAERCGVTKREIQAALEGAKRAGMPVVTGSAGVWLSYDVAELQAFYRANRRRIHTQWRNARGTLKAIERLQGVHQETLFGEAA
jgi:hypothetical protein